MSHSLLYISAVSTFGWLRTGCVMLALSLCFLVVGCGEPEDITLKPKQDLKAALGAYYTNNLDSFFLCMDFGTELDTVQKQVILATYKRNLAYTEENFGGVRMVEPKSVILDGDSVAFVLYDLVYGNQLRETTSQKMVKVGDSWKLRVRN